MADGTTGRLEPAGRRRREGIAIALFVAQMGERDWREPGDLAGARAARIAVELADHLADALEEADGGAPRFDHHGNYA